MCRRLITVAPGQSPRRLDVFLSAQNARLSRSAARRLIERGAVTVNGRTIRPARRIRPGDVIAYPGPAAPRARVVAPEPIAIDVLYEDAAIAVVDKPAGLVMHPAPGHWTGTLLNGLVHHLGAGAAGQENARRPGLVHRLDRGTSGVVVIAKTDDAHRALSAQFRAHTIGRVYLALIAGRVRRGGVVDRPIGRDPRVPHRVSVDAPGARRAVTEYRVVARWGREATLVEVRPRTGRMHQIRVHLASIGHPLLGDAAYGGPTGEAWCRRPMLHAAALAFVHPVTGARVEYRAPLPADMAAAIAELTSRRSNAAGA